MKYYDFANSARLSPCSEDYKSPPPLNDVISF